MRTSSDHILTSHVGSLPRPDDLIEANRAREAPDMAGQDVIGARPHGSSRGRDRQPSVTGPFSGRSRIRF